MNRILEPRFVEATRFTSRTKTIPDLGVVDYEFGVKPGGHLLVGGEIRLWVQHEYMSDCSVSLIAPNGVQFIAYNRDEAYDYTLCDYGMDLAGLARVPVSGLWRVRFQDWAKEDEGFVDQIVLQLRGEVPGFSFNCGVRHDVIQETRDMVCRCCGSGDLKPRSLQDWDGMVACGDCENVQDADESEYVAGIKTLKRREGKKW